MKPFVVFIFLSYCFIGYNLFAQKSQPQRDEALVGEWLFLFSKDANSVIQPTDPILRNARRQYYANGTLSSNSPYKEQKLSKLNLKSQKSSLSWSTRNGNLIITQNQPGMNTGESTYKYVINADTLIVIDYKGTQNYWLKRVQKNKNNAK
ncbi:MAG: hypothetical protein HRU69_06455 [Flammeovirgaceae bacterium]|jgi:hypothetical protein|nr:MAG: hypothetical protein HRU69_06455 [Flammeovirgaceae bacterium]